MANRWLEAAGVALCGFAFFLPRPAQAGIISINDPGGMYQPLTTTVPIPNPSASSGPPATLSFVSNGTETVTFTPTVESRTFSNGFINPPDNRWATWGSPPQTESSNPGGILSTPGANTTSLTLTLNHPVATFGLEAQPTAFEVLPITAQFFDSNNDLLGTITRNVDGLGDPLNPSPGGGALLFAATTTGNDLIASVVLSVGAVPIPGEPNGLGLSQIRFSGSQLSVVNGEVTGLATVPEPTTLSLFGLGAAGLLAYRAVRRRLRN